MRCQAHGRYGESLVEFGPQNTTGLSSKVLESEPEGEGYEVWGIEMLLGTNEGLVSCTSDQCLIGSSGRSRWFFVMIINLDRGSRNSHSLRAEFKSAVIFQRRLN